MSDLLDFYEQLQADVIAEAHGSSADEYTESDFKENAFTKIVTDDLAAAGVLESPVVCHYQPVSGSAGMKINAYCIPDEDTRVDLVISDYSYAPEPKRLTAADVDRSMNAALRFFKATISARYQSTDPGTDEYSMMRDIFSHKDDLDRIQIVLITNGIVVQRKEKVRKETFEAYRVTYDVWDIERLRRFRSGGSSHEPIEVDLSEHINGGIPCVSILDESLGYCTSVSMLPGSMLHDWYDEYGARLLELNVRSYLQARGKINKGILETLLKEPHRFLAYNNGITIVAEHIVFNDAQDRILAIRGLQIVNGGQTTASIHRAKKEGQADLSHVYVQAKLTVVPPHEFEAMVPEISRYSNTQNKVTEVDLRANHAFHVGIERVANKTWIPGEQSMWFYERARGSYQTERSKANTPSKRAKFDREFPSSQRLSKEDLARYSNIWSGLPHIVSRGGQKNFTRFMESVPNVAKDWEPSAEEFKTLIAKAILYRQAQHIAKKLEIPAFRINIVNYTVALLVDKTAGRIDLLAVWERQGLSDSLSAQIREWLPLVENALLSTAGGRNPTEWFKVEQCWKQLRESGSSWDLTLGVSTQLKKTAVAGHAVPDAVHNNVARCMQVDAAKWFQIQIWGSESGSLQEWQIGIANTLAGYAAQGWKKRPSEKQAAHGVKILEAYAESGEN